jgi:hypothetical protein
MPVLSPALLIATASAMIGRNPDQRAATAPEPLTLQEEANPILRDLHAPSDGEGTAAFITHAGFWSHRRGLGRSTWPIDPRADCDGFVEFGARHGLLTVGTPDRGSIYLRYSTTAQRYTRAGIVLWAMELPATFSGWSYDCLVLEGSAQLTSLVYRTQGDGVQFVSDFLTEVRWARRTRTRCLPFLGDVFLNWFDADSLGWQLNSASTNPPNRPTGDDDTKESAA